MNTTLSPVTAQRFFSLQHELIELVADDFSGLTSKLEQLLRAFEWSQIEQSVSRARGYDLARGVGQPEVDRCALACAFLAKAVFDLKSTRALIDRLSSDRKLARLCGFDLRKSLPSEATFSRAFAEIAKSELLQKLHEGMIKSVLGDVLIGHISRDSTAIVAREAMSRKEAEAAQAAQATQATRSVEDAQADIPSIQTIEASQAIEESSKSQTKTKTSYRRGRPKKGEVRPEPQMSLLKRQQKQSLPERLKGLKTVCDKGTKRNAQGYQTSWRGYKLHLDTACCGVPISALLTSASVHDSSVALPLMQLSSARVQACYELMDAGYCSTIIREEVIKAGRVPLVDHNPRKGQKREFAPHEAERYKTRSAAERTNARLKDEFGARHITVRGHAKVMCHLMLGIIALCSDQLTRLLL